MFLGIGLGLTQQAIGGGVAGLNAQLASAAGIQPAISADLKSGQAWLRGAPYALTSLPGWGFTRAGGGYGETSAGALTWFNGPRTNLCLQSQTFDNASWVKSRATVTADAIAAPDGTLTADKLTEDTNNGTHRVYQTLSKATSAIRYVVSCCFKKAERSFAQIRCFSTGELAGYGVVINLDTGEVSAPYSTGFTGGAAWAESLGDGWFRLILTFITDTEAAFTTYLLPAQSLTASSPAYVGDGSSGVYIWGAQVELAQNPANPQPTDYIPTTTATVTVASQPRLVPGRGQLIEGARTNLLLQSGFAGGGAVPTSWTQPSATGTSTPSTSTKNPDVVAYTQSGTAQRPFFNQSVTFASNTTYVLSVYVEEVSGTIALADFMTGTSLPSGCTITGDGLGNLVTGQRRTIVFSGTYTGAAVSIRIGLGVNGGATGTVRFSMPQVEAGAFPSSFISTTTTSVTRPADIPLIDISAYSPAITYPLTMYARFERVVDTGGTEEVLNTDAGSTSDRLRLTVSSADVAQAVMVTASATEANPSAPGTLALGTSYRMAARYGVNSCQIARSGSLGTEDVLCAVPPTPTAVRIGCNASGGNPTFGYLSEFAIIPGAVSDANLVRLAAA
jgi:hypothetical protein